MKAAIIYSIVIGVIGPFFIMFVYIIFSVVASLIKNIGKDEFIWYGQPLERTYAKLVPYDTFGDMIKAGVKMSLKMDAVMIVLAFLVILYFEMTGWK